MKKTLVDAINQNLNDWIGHTNTEAEVIAQRRIQMWLKMRAHSDKKIGKSKNFNASKIIHFVAEGRISAACKLLSSGSIASPSQETIDALLSKHPEGPEISRKYVTEKPIQCTEKEVRANIFKFRKGSAGDWSGLRPDHLKESLDSFNQSSPLTAITLLVNKIAHGDIPACVRPYLGGASLIPLTKKDGGVRPIAIGNSFRRLACKCALAALGSTARDFLMPSQVGVAVPGGGEAVVHAWRDLQERFANDPNKVGLKIDFSNAFNEVDREAMINEVVNHFPSLYPLADLLYSSFSNLRVHTSWIESKKGTHQGCPLASFLFCLVLRLLINQIKNDCPHLDLNVWYLDDGSLVGSIDDIVKALEIISQRGPSYGLHVNLAKCQVVWFASPTNDPLPPTLQRYNVGEMDMLGSAISSSGKHCSDWIDSNAGKKTRQILSQLGKIDHKQTEYIITRYCASFCKIVFFIRTCPPSLASDACKKFDTEVYKALEAQLGTSIGDPTLSLAQLPIKKGGLGLRSASQHAVAAYISSFHNNRELIKQLLNRPPSDNHFKEAVEIFNKRVDAHQRIDLANLPDSLPQQILSSSIDEVIQAEIKNSFIADNGLAVNQDRNLAVLKGFAAPHAGDFLLAPPSEELALSFSNEEWRCLLKRRLIIPVIEEEDICLICKKKNVDISGDHCLRCDSGNARINRHDAIKERIVSDCQSARLAPTPEPSDFTQFHIRPDIKISNFSLGRDTYLDIAVTDPTQKKYVQEATSTLLHSAEHYASTVKDPIYQDICEKKGVDFFPIVVETTGGWCVAAIQFFNKLIPKIAAARRISLSLATQQLYMRLSVILQRANARMILNRTERDEDSKEEKETGLKASSAEFIPSSPYFPPLPFPSPSI